MGLNLSTLHKALISKVKKFVKADKSWIVDIEAFFDNVITF